MQQLESQIRFFAAQHHPRAILYFEVLENESNPMRLVNLADQRFSFTMDYLQSLTEKELIEWCEERKQAIEDGTEEIVAEMVGPPAVEEIEVPARELARRPVRVNELFAIMSHMFSLKKVVASINTKNVERILQLLLKWTRLCISFLKDTRQVWKSHWGRAFDEESKLLSNKQRSPFALAGMVLNAMQTILTSIGNALKHGRDDNIPWVMDKTATPIFVPLASSIIIEISVGTLRVNFLEGDMLEKMLETSKGLQMLQSWMFNDELVKMITAEVARRNARDLEYFFQPSLHALTQPKNLSSLQEKHFQYECLLVLGNLLNNNKLAECFVRSAEKELKMQQKKGTTVSEVEGTPFVLMHPLSLALTAFVKMGIENLNNSLGRLMLQSVANLFFAVGTASVESTQCKKTDPRYTTGLMMHSLFVDVVINTDLITTIHEALNSLVEAHLANPASIAKTAEDISELVNCLESIMFMLYENTELGKNTAYPIGEMLPAVTMKLAETDFFTTHLAIASIFIDVRDGKLRDRVLANMASQLQCLLPDRICFLFQRKCDYLLEDLSEDCAELLENPAFKEKLIPLKEWCETPLNQIAGDSQFAILLQRAERTISPDCLKNTTVCSNCCSPPTSGPLKKCSACYSVNYCSKYCQRQHWPSHKPICAERSFQLPYMPRSLAHQRNMAQLARYQLNRTMTNICLTISRTCNTRDIDQLNIVLFLDLRGGIGKMADPPTVALFNASRFRRDGKGWDPALSKYVPHPEKISFLVQEVAQKVEDGRNPAVRAALGDQIVVIARLTNVFLMIYRLTNPASVGLQKVIALAQAANQYQNSVDRTHLVDVYY